jgi:DedD protein
MNDHNLDDLIIDNIEPNKKKKSNSLLTIVALAIIVMIVAIILTKVILKDPEIGQVSVDQDDTELVSPDLTLQPVEEEDNEIEAPISEPSQEEKVVVEKPEAPALKPAPTPEVKEEPAVQSTVSTEPVMEPVKEEPKKEIPQVVVPKKVETPKTEQAPQKTVEQATQKPSTRPANVITRPESVYSPTTTAAYYIQVGAFNRTPGKDFISKIEQNGFRHKVITSKSGSKKVLVGPYPDRQSVDKALIQVRDRIAKDAFVYQK